MFEMFFTFMRIGLFTIGGGYAMIPLIEEQVVRRKQWLTAEELIDLIAVAQSCPGIFAVNIIPVCPRRRAPLVPHYPGHRACIPPVP